MPYSRRQRALATLLELVRLGAGDSHVDVSSSRLATSLDLTQQGASHRLIELESDGLIERVRSGRGLAVKLTPAGERLVRLAYAPVRAAFEKGADELSFRGRVFAGLGEGGYYVSLGGYARPFLSSLGFVPFAGTLNLRLTSPEMVERRRSLDSLPGVDVPGFSDGQRTYGPVKCFRARVARRLRGAVLAIERTHYDSTVLEVISPVNLRKALRLNDGDELSVSVSLAPGPGPRPRTRAPPRR